MKCKAVHFFITFILIYFPAIQANAQNNLKYRPRIANFEYIEIVKGKESSEMPLLIAFHYSGGNPLETLRDYDSLKNPVRIIIPRGNFLKRDGFSYYPTDYYQKDSVTQFALARRTVDSLALFIMQIEKKYKQKAVVSGISQGGDISLLLAIYYPALCKASFPFAAVIHPHIIESLKIKPAREVPVYLFQGEDDKIIPVSVTRKKVEQIGSGMNIRLQTYANLGHDISLQMKVDYSKLIDGINMSGQSYKQTIDMRIAGNVQFVNIAGIPTSYYEVYVTNFSTDSFYITKLEVVETNDATVLFTSQDKDLQDRVVRIGAKLKDTNNLLPPGATVIVYVELQASGKKSIGTIGHYITITDLHNRTNGYRIKGPVTKPKVTTEIILGPPLKNGTWSAIYHPVWERGHRRVIYTQDGIARIPGRYAIDFIKVDSAGRYANGNENSITNWIGYGEEVIAVADGIVESVENNFPESPTLAAHPRYSPDKATGNYASIRIANGVYAFYEHLKPGSIRVKPGQRIKKGDIIGEVGFTGQSAGPHLHFHIADNNSPLGAEGLPFSFERFMIHGTYSSVEMFGKQLWEKPKGINSPLRTNERPPPNSVISF
ncbi:MAG TPA: peptidoglycan DD-metalloendopeptidase family protein [Chitinophagaceae bacterium]